MTRLDRLRELEKQATPGPWSYLPCEYIQEDGEDIVIQAAYVPEIKKVEWAGDYCDMTNEDAELIAESRNALPLLLELAEAVREARYGGRDVDELYSAVIQILTKLEEVKGNGRAS